SGQRLIDLVGTRRRGTVRPMWLLGQPTPEEDVAEARAKVAEGIGFFKLKIGVKPLTAEIVSTLAMREALGPAPTLCADANCGVTLAQARRYVERTRSANLLFVEQPLPPDDLVGLKSLARASRRPIGIDEGIRAIADIETNAKAGAGGVSLKLGKLGGFIGALEAAKVCRRLRLKVNVAARMAESSIPSPAPIHPASAVPKIDGGGSLTHFYLAHDLVRHPPALRDGQVTLPDGPGLGVEVDETAVERFRVR